MNSYCTFHEEAEEKTDTSKGKNDKHNNSNHRSPLLIESPSKTTTTTITTSMTSMMNIPPSREYSSPPSNREILFVKFVFYMLGTGFLLPWNSFISAQSYFVSRFTKSCGVVDPTVNATDAAAILSMLKGDNDDSASHDTDKADDGSSFMSWFGLLYNLTGVVTLTFLLLKQRANEIQKERQLQEEEEDDGVEEVEEEENEVELSSDIHNDTTTPSTLNEPSTETMNSTISAAPTATSISNAAHTEEAFQDDDIDAVRQSMDEKRSSDSTSSRSPQWRTITTSLSIYLIVMAVTSIFVLIPTFNKNSNTIQLFKTLTFICIAICGTTGAFTSASIVSYANSYFPPLYSVQCFISGQALGGVAISILNLVLDYVVDGDNEDTFWIDQCGVNKNDYDLGDARAIGYGYNHGGGDSSSNRQMLSLDDHLSYTRSLSSSCHDYKIDWGAFSYFTVCCVFLVSSIGLFILLDASSVTQYYRHHNKDEIVASIDDSLRMENEEDVNDEYEENREDMEDRSETGLSSPLIEPLVQDSPQQQDAMYDDTKKNNVTIYVWKIIQAPTICIFVTFVITLMIFPSWTGLLESVLKCQEGSSRFRNDLFTPLMVVLFNIFDLAGRILSGFVMNHISRGQSNRSSAEVASLSLVSKRIGKLSFMRILFLPTFYLCKSSTNSVNIFGSDIYTFALMVSFAFSNGLVSTLSFIHAATLLSQNSEGDNNHDEEEVQGVASTLLNFAVGLGLLAGSMTSFVYNTLGSMFS